MKRFILLFISVLFFSSFAQKDKKNFIIVWTNENCLVWDDFLAKPPNNSKYVAISDIYINSVSLLGNNAYDVLIKTCFNKHNSWVDKKYKDDYTLNHEQIHFNLAEVTARNFRKEVLATKFKAKTFNKKMQSLNKRYTQIFHKEQALYDKETDGGNNKEKQNEWNEKVANELKELEEYKDFNINVPLSD